MQNRKPRYSVFLAACRREAIKIPALAKVLSSTGPLTVSEIALEAKAIGEYDFCRRWLAAVDSRRPYEK